MSSIRQKMTALTAVMIMLLAGCAVTNLTNSIPEVFNGEQSSGYGEITINVPDAGRGWDVAKYKVTASRSGETDVSGETTGTSLSMRLKVGQWSFVAQGYDSNGVLIYQSTAKLATVSENDTKPISLLLDQQSCAVKYSWTADDLFISKYPLTKIKVTAESSAAGFDNLAGEVSDITQSVTLKGLLANAAYTVNVVGYIGDTVYVSNRFTQAGLTDKVNVTPYTKVLSQSKVTPIELSDASGMSFSSQTKTVTLSNDTSGVSIYYTLDGSTPTSSSPKYNGGIQIFKNMAAAGNVTLKAIAVSSGLTSSDIVTAVYRYTPNQASTPSFSPIGGTYASDQTVTLTNNESSGTIMYKADNGSWSVYSEPIEVSGNGTVKTITAKVTNVTGMTESGEVSQTYTITYPKLASPIISPEAGSYTSSQLFTLTASVDGAEIYYTTDGTAPTAGSTKYVGPFSLPVSEDAYTIKAFCVKSGYTDSNKESFGPYTIANESASGGFDLITAKPMQYDEGEQTWTNNADDSNLSVGVTVFSAGEFAPNKTYQLSWSPANLSAAVTIYKNDYKAENQITAIRSEAKIEWTTDASVTSKDMYYFFFNATAAVDSVQLTIVEDGTVINVTNVAISPKTEDALSISVNDTITFGVVYTPANATAGKEVTWSVGNSAVLAISGSTATALKAGVSTVTATLKGNTSVKDTVTVTVTPATTTTTTTTTTTIPVDGANIYVKASSAPKIWVWQDGGAACCELMGYTWNSQPVMTAATGMNDTTGWYMFNISSAYMTSGKTFTFILNENSGNIATTKTKTFWYDNGTYYDSDPTASVTTTTVGPSGDDVNVYVASSSAPSLWIWQPDGAACLEEMGYTWNTQPTMSAAVGLNNNTGWYMFTIPAEYVTAGKAFTFILNKTSGNITSTKTKTFWYDDGTFYDADPTVKPDPVAPKVTIKPANGGKLPLNGTVTITLDNGYDTISSATVTLSGGVSRTYSYTDFTNDVLTIGASTLGISEGDTLTVSASVTNGKGTANASSALTVTAESKDYFTWDNVNAYFVLTDRFYNGNTSNDGSYGRQRASGDEDVATFHGGDLAGLTQKMDYFKNLGINAIWITAPYEQAHGWVGGKGGAFPHYAFHGYYTLDWSALDQNMGTLDEFRTFVTACHANGIRVIMDVVMNHVGYNNVADMVTYHHGYTPHEATWFAKTDGVWNANDGVQWDNSLWDNSWFGPWIRSFGYNSGTEYGGSCGGLPDVKTELTESVGLAPVHVTKWSTDSASVKSAYYNPSVSNVDWNGWSGDFRTDKGVPPAIYQEVWLSAWVREFGIDGFRCDTAKHVEPYRWGELKRACQAALEAWRADSSKVDNTGAKDWDENFWMTGEHWGWTSTAGSGDYYTTGGFDSMINFSFNGNNSWDGNYRTNYPTESSWGSYLSINNNDDSDSNGNRNNVLTYISSHDTGLTRVGDQKEVGTGLVLLPGGVQIYYGDESIRPKAYTGCGDGDMYTRGDMNWDNSDTVAHWGKLGRFRKFNPAVGAGTGSAMKRSYSGAAGDNKVAIGVSGTSVDVSGLFANGTTVYNWYDGTSATVSGGSVSFAGDTMSQPILVSERNPADYQ